MKNALSVRLFVGAVILAAFVGTLIGGDKKEDSSRFWVSGPKNETIPLHRSPDGRLCVTVRVGDEKLNFYIDTGASTAIHGEHARRLRIKSAPSGINTVDPLGNSVPLMSANADLRLGRFSLSNYPVIVPDLSELRKMNDEQGLPKLDGILGSDVLHTMRAQLDFSAETLLLIKPQ